MRTLLGPLATPYLSSPLVSHSPRSPHGWIVSTLLLSESLTAGMACSTTSGVFVSPQPYAYSVPSPQTPLSHGIRHAYSFFETTLPLSPLGQRGRGGFCATALRSRMVFGGGKKGYLHLAVQNHFLLSTADFRLPV